MSGQIVLEQVILLFILMAVGFIAKKLGMLNSEVNKKLSEILLNITTPAIVIASFHVEFSRNLAISGIIVFSFSVIISMFSMLLGEVLFTRYPEEVRKVLKHLTVYPNCGYMGIPILGGLFGTEGIFYASIYMMVFNLFVWTNGVAIFTGNKGLKSVRGILINPGTVSVFVGTLIFVFSIRLPAPVFGALDALGSMTVPLSMLIIGALIADVRLISIFKGSAVYVASLLRLIALPLISFIGLCLLGFPPQLVTACVALVAMPAAVNTAIFAEKFGGDSSFASKCVAFTTLLSIATLPLVIYLSQVLYRYMPVMIRLWSS